MGVPFSKSKDRLFSFRGFFGEICKLLKFSCQHEVQSWPRMCLYVLTLRKHFQDAGLFLITANF